MSDETPSASETIAAACSITAATLTDKRVRPLIESFEFLAIHGEQSLAVLTSILARLHGDSLIRECGSLEGALERLSQLRMANELDGIIGLGGDL